MEITAARPTAVAATAPPADMFLIHARRFQCLSYAAIGVSFVHQAASLLLFSGSQWYDWLAGMGMTSIVDLALWMLGEYLYEARRARRPVFWAVATFLMATAVSIGLNFTYLYTHRPNAELLDETLSTVIAGVFAVFVPLLIAVCGLVRAELARWQTESAADAATVASATAEARKARARVAELEAALADQQQRFAQAVDAGTEQTRRHTAAEQQAREAHATATEQARQIAELTRQLAEARATATAAHGGATELERRATVAERQAAEQARQATELERRATAAERLAAEWERAATALPTRATVAERLRAALSAGATVASLARETGWKESTLRDMVAAA